MDEKKAFDNWYIKEERRFHCAHMNEKEIAFSAFLEGIKFSQEVSMNILAAIEICKRFGIDLSFVPTITKIAEALERAYEAGNQDGWKETSSEYETE